MWVLTVFKEASTHCHPTHPNFLSIPLARQGENNLKHQYKHFLIKTHEFDNIRDSPEAKFTIQIYFCTPTVQLLLLCLRTVQIT